MIRKAVIPAAGFGTRFLPATKCSPKEMLPIVDTPVIQYVVEEAVASGITDILMVIGRGKRAIEEHFDRSAELEWELEAKGKLDQLRQIRRISNLANIHFVWQKQMLGLGDAIRCAEAHVGSEPFAVLLGDTLLQSTSGTPAIRQLIDAYEERRTCVVAVEEVSRERVSKYGVISGEPLAGGKIWRVDDLVEKPAPDEAPSNLAIASRYVLTPDIFATLRDVRPGKGGEIQLTDALRLLAHASPIHARVIDAIRHDVGNHLGFIKTNIIYGLLRPELRETLGAFIKETAARL
ncbi:MAG: UTP--glucose-1-phosphate uridylyltransferase GalU [Kiritimatiellae bacterium]|nr:UTP--glucose-1-phosphate uridylyltransferase GalU [Kiritimatiellia bacterium]